jgi:hypothetical protein
MTPLTLGPLRVRVTSINGIQHFRGQMRALVVRPSSGLTTRQWMVSPLWHISTYFAMRAARVSGFFASWTR